jgi:predicted helicase
MDELWEDLKRPVQEAGQGGQLNTFPEFSVAFWRWAIWKLFEAENAPRRGVIAFISNRKFLTGWPYAGLRKMMRERFDRVEVIDLRGDVRAGPRGDVEADQGVFNIMVGTAITLAIADGSKADGELADVFYTDCWKADLFSRGAKLEWLTAGAPEGRLTDGVAVDRGVLDDWRPAPFQNGDWLNLAECFEFKSSGVETTRDHLAYATTAERLRAQIREFLGMPEVVARDHYSQSRKENFRVARTREVEGIEMPEVGYRPLDTRVLFNDSTFVDWPRPALQRAWGKDNIALFAMAYATGAGPAIWCQSAVPDRHAFRGSTGGYVIPLYDRRAGPDAHNLNPALVAALAEAYGEAQSPEDIFDAVLCLLSAQSYTSRFAEDLEDTFPHTPFPADPEVFRQAVEIGREIRELEAFEREPAAAFRPRDFCRIVTEPGPNTVIGTIRYAEGELSLWEEDGRAITAFTGLPQAVWDFAVSGYRVLPRWIDGRKGLPFDNAMKDALRDVAARIHELIHWFERADLVLEATLADTLTREELGFAAEVQDTEADQGDE